MVEFIILLLLNYGDGDTVIASMSEAILESGDDVTYEVFTRKTRRVGTPCVTFTKTGRIALNQAATAQMRKLAVEYVALLWDSSANKFAVRPVTTKDARSYKLNFGVRDNGAGFSAVTFMDHIGYDFKKRGSVQFSAQWNESEGMFEVSMQDTERREEAPLLKAIEGKATER